MAKYSLITSLTLNAAGYNKGLGAAKAQTTQFAKGIESMSANAKSAFGNLTSMISPATAGFGGLATSALGAGKAFLTMIPAINGVSAAFIATGIGAAIVAIGVAVSGLITWFKRSEEGQIAFKKAMNGIKAVIEPVLSVLGQFGKAVYLLVQGKFSEAWNTAKAAVQGVGKAISDNVDNLGELNAAEESLVKTRRSNAVEIAKLEADLSTIRNKAVDTENYNAQQRLEFSKQAFAISNQITQRKTEELNLEEKVATLKAAQGDNDIATNNELNQLKIDRIKFQKEESDRNRELLGTQKSITAEVKNQLNEFMKVDQLKEGLKISAEVDLDLGSSIADSLMDVDKDIQSDFDNIFKNVKVPTEVDDFVQDYGKKLEAAKEKQELITDGFASAFDSITSKLVDGLGLAENGIQGFMSVLVQFAMKSISAYLAQSLAASILGATQSGVGTGFAAFFTTPAFIASAIATVGAAFAAIPKFETGGIVGGGSYYGDKILARVNSGEMILNKNQQGSLYNQLNNSSSSRNNTINVNLTASGGDLKAAFNYDTRKNKLIR